MLMLTQHFLLLLDINGIQMAKGGFYGEAAGDAMYFTLPLLALMAIKLEHGEASELFDKELQAFTVCGERSTEF